MEHAGEVQYGREEADRLAQQREIVRLRQEEEAGEARELFYERHLGGMDAAEHEGQGQREAGMEYADRYVHDREEEEADRLALQEEIARIRQEEEAGEAMLFHEEHPLEEGLQGQQLQDGMAAGAHEGQWQHEAGLLAHLPHMADDELMFGPFSDEEEDEIEGQDRQGFQGPHHLRPPRVIHDPNAAVDVQHRNAFDEGADEALGDIDVEADMAPDDVLQWTDDDEDDDDTTAAQAAAGRDMQGIPWDRLQFSREHYRETRIKQYRNYVNVLPENPEQYRPELLRKCKLPLYGSSFFSFHHNNRAVNTTIVHFQLRNLVWATSRNDVFVVSQNSINHWNPARRKITEVVNLSGTGKCDTLAPGVGKVQVSTLCVRNDVIAAGGFGGELVVKRLGDPGWVYAGRISHSENGITNGLELFEHGSHGCCIVAANNDALVRLYRADYFKCIAQWEFPWAVNYASAQPISGCYSYGSDGCPAQMAGGLVAVVGDDPVTHLNDIRTGSTVAKLQAHEDYSFAAAWHPSGHLLATGNQDTSVVVWDIRKNDRPLARMAGRMGAIRALRWSPDGRFLAASEPADFVHVYDAASDFDHAQEIDLFGEISGVSFTPVGDQLLVGIADITYASLLTFTRARQPQQYVTAVGPTFLRGLLHA